MLFSCPDFAKDKRFSVQINNAIPLAKRLKRFPMAREHANHVMVRSTNNQQDQNIALYIGVNPKEKCQSKRAKRQNRYRIPEYP